MSTSQDILPAIKICTHCPNLCTDFIEVDVGNGEVDSIFSWFCALDFDDLLFYDDAKNIRDNNGIIPLGMKSLPLECPYTLEHLFCQDTAGRERFNELLPLMGKKV